MLQVVLLSEKDCNQHSADEIESELPQFTTSISNIAGNSGDAPPPVVPVLENSCYCLARAALAQSPGSCQYLLQTKDKETESQRYLKSL